MPSEPRTPDDAAPASSYLPIREVARVTGVNAVTLRAWERRYGLIVPYRTPKGHRLYSPANIEHIHAVLGWLNQGVAVGQVKALLQGSQPLAAPPEDNWQQLRSELHGCISQLAERRLDERFNGAMALYPTRTLVARLLWPLLDELQQHGRPGASIEQVFFHSWLRGKLAARLYHNNRQASGAPVLLTPLSEGADGPGLWLCAWLISDAGCPVHLLDQPLAPLQLQQVVQRMALRALLAYTGDTPPAPRQQQALSRIAAVASLPLLLTGSALPLHGAPCERLARAGDPLAAYAWLREQGVLDLHKEQLPCTN